MPTLTYIEHNGESHVVDARVGDSVMQAAVRADVPNILAECGGACACATCHVYVDPAWRGATGEPSEMEAQMLEFADSTTEDSRLSCQIKITEGLDGLVVRLPEVQG
jgi:2Fe-2S ferredoxin